MSSNTDVGSLKGRRIQIRLSEPFDLGEALGWSELPGRIIAADASVDAGQVLLRLDDPVRHEGVTCEYVVATPRLDDGDLGTLVRDGSLFCNLTPTSPERARSDDPFDLSWWRGGLACIGEIYLIADQ
jgi:hypothetical protein